MKKQLVLSLLVLALLVCLYQNPAYAELRTIVPEGVREIDLRTVLGDDALEVSEAWMLNTDIFVCLRNQPEDEGCELIVLDTQNGLILSRTPIPHIDYPDGQHWDAGVLTLWFKIWGNTADWEPYDRAPTDYFTASVSLDGTVDVSVITQSGYTIMPGSKTAVREANDGSIYAVDLATGEEELLLQGSTERCDAAQKYVPFWDELPDAPEGREFQFYPFQPGDTRMFYMYKPLDEYRFVYQVKGWEWGAGYGVYDLRTRTDHRITGRGAFFGITGDTLFGEALQADVNTYESSPLPGTVQDVFWNVAFSWCNSVHSDYDISPDGKLLALLWKEDSALSDDPITVTITDIQSGDTIKTYVMDNPFATEHSVAFYDDTRLMLFSQPEPLGSAYIYLFNLGK